MVLIAFCISYINSAQIVSTTVSFFDLEWEAFKSQFGKIYSSTEDLKRYQIFQENLNYIEQKNAENSTFKVGMNIFGDFVNFFFLKKI